MEIKRDSVVIYRNLYEALQGVSDKAYKRIMNAILKYSMDGEEILLTGVEKAVFQMAKTQVDSNNKKYENGKKGAEYGHLGGRPKKEKETEETPRKPQENPTKTPNEPLNVKCKMLNNKESKKEDKDNINNQHERTRESYAQVMEEFRVSVKVQEVLWEFIRHCLANKHVITNDKLEDIIIRLDENDEVEQIEMLKRAISGGYYDIKRR